MLDLKRFEVMSFDCYGTLIDWERGILEALRPVLAAHEIVCDDEQILEIYGQIESASEQGPYRKYRAILEEMVRQFGLRFGFEPSQQEVAALPESIANWIPFSDTVAALQRLQRRLQLVILSNVDRDLFALTAQHLQVEFLAVITAEEVGSYKPSLRNFEYLQHKLNIGTDRHLHVAQSLYHDIVPARALGIATVWVNRRHNQAGSGATPPTSAQPDLEVPDLETLAAMLDS